MTTQMPVADLPASAEPVTYRIWCAAPELASGSQSRLEFQGWLIGWGEGSTEEVLEELSLRETSSVRTRTEVGLFLTAAGKVVATVNLVPGNHPLDLGRPPEMWAMFAATHENLSHASRWLRWLRWRLGSSVAASAIEAAIASGRKRVWPFNALSAGAQ